MRFYGLLGIVFASNYLFEAINGQEPGNYFLQAAKNVPRIGRSNSRNSNIDEMGRFLMKASKSVPRIGRRNQNQEHPAQLQLNGASGVFAKRANYPVWGDLPEKLEYDPELFASPDVFALLEQEMGDDPSAYDFNTVRIKRTIHPRFQQH